MFMTGLGMKEIIVKFAKRNKIEYDKQKTLYIRCSVCVIAAVWRMQCHEKE